MNIYFKSDLLYLFFSISTTAITVILLQAIIIYFIDSSKSLLAS